MRYTVRNLLSTVTTESVLANSKTQNAFLFPVHAVSSRLPPSVETCKYAMVLIYIYIYIYIYIKERERERGGKKKEKKNSRDSLPIYMLLSAVSVLVVTQPILEVLGGIMNYPVYAGFNTRWCLQYVPGWCSATVLTACCTKSISHQCRHMLHSPRLLREQTSGELPVYMSIQHWLCFHILAKLVTPHMKHHSMLQSPS